jgi:hypothetical protein
VQSDVDRHAVDVTASVGEATARLSVGRIRDNLADLASILTTRTAATDLAVAVPFTVFRPDLGCAPMATYETQRVAQTGDGLPINGDFDSLSHVPDQVSVLQQVGVTLGCQRWRTGYRLSTSTQDNRQPGRELADFTTRVHSFSGGVMPSSRLDVGVEVSLERATSLEVARHSDVHRVGVTAHLQLTRQTALQVLASRNRTSDSDSEAVSTATDWNGLFAHTVSLGRRGPHAVTAQLSLRIARQGLWRLDGAGLPVPQRAWSMQTGVSLRIF